VTRFCDLVHTVLGRVLVVLVGTMALTVAWQVSSRLLARLCLGLGWPVFIQPSRWTEELAGFQLSWVALLGAAWVLREGTHPGLDLVHRMLGPLLRRRTEALGAALVALFSVVVLFYGGLRLVVMTSELGQRTAALGWPMAAVYSVVPVAGGLLALFAVEALVRSIKTSVEGRA